MGWRKVSVHGQPPSDAVVVARRIGVSSCKPGAPFLSHPFGREERILPGDCEWHPAIIAADGDYEPPPLPKPFKPIETLATYSAGSTKYRYVQCEVMVLVSHDRVSMFHHGYQVTADCRGWCTPEQWHDFLFGGER